MLSTIMTQIDKQEDQANRTRPELQAVDHEPDQAGLSLASDLTEGAEQQYGLQLTLESGESQLFTGLPISIGRAENNDLVLAEATVSAQHARIYYDEAVSELCIVDLDSLNGLFIDGQPTHRNLLFDGAKIGLGAATLTFRDTGFIYSG
jgi:hypothetical protein